MKATIARRLRALEGRVPEPPLPEPETMDAAELARRLDVIDGLSDDDAIRQVDAWDAETPGLRIGNVTTAEQVRSMRALRAALAEMATD